MSGRINFGPTPPNRDQYAAVPSARVPAQQPLTIAINIVNSSYPLNDFHPSMRAVLYRDNTLSGRFMTRREGDNKSYHWTASPLDLNQFNNGTLVVISQNNGLFRMSAAVNNLIHTSGGISFTPARR